MVFDESYKDIYVKIQFCSRHFTAIGEKLYSLNIVDLTVYFQNIRKSFVYICNEGVNCLQ